MSTTGAPPHTMSSCEATGLGTRGGLAGGSSVGLGLPLAGEQHLTSCRPWQHDVLVAGPQPLRKPLRTVIDRIGRVCGSLSAATNTSLGPAAVMRASYKRGGAEILVEPHGRRGQRGDSVLLGSPQSPLGALLWAAFWAEWSHRPALHPSGR